MKDGRKSKRKKEKKIKYERVFIFKMTLFFEDCFSWTYRLHFYV